MKEGDSFILRAITSFLFFLVNVFAVYLLLRGHNLPGGGFIGGLGCALSIILLMLAYGIEETERIVRIDPVRIAAAGLAVALGSALLPVFLGDAFLKHYNLKYKDLPLVGDLSVGTPLLFDVGVYLVVVGVATKLIFVLARSITGLTALSDREQGRYASSAESPIEDAGEREESVPSNGNDAAPPPAGGPEGRSHKNRPTIHRS